MPHNAKIVTFDIETAPAVAYIWNRWKENISVDKVISEGYVLCAVAKFLNEKQTRKSALPDYPTKWKKDKEDDTEVVKWCWDILNEADIVIAHNAKRFDIPVLNTRFIKLGLPPPAPYKMVDTLEVVKRKFRFPYNSLHGVLTYLEMDTKHDTSFKLWKGCREGDEKSWKEMVKYCEQDVKVLENLYKKLVPWTDNHPNLGLYTDMKRPACPKCGGTKSHRRGVYNTTTQSYARYTCVSCGGWFRERISSLEKDQRKNIVTNTAI